MDGSLVGHFFSQFDSQFDGTNSTNFFFRISQVRGTSKMEQLSYHAERYGKMFLPKTGPWKRGQVEHRLE